MAPTHATFLAVHCSWSRPSTFPAAEVSMVMVIELVDGGMLNEWMGSHFSSRHFEQLSDFWREIELQIPTWTQ